MYVRVYTHGYVSECMKCKKSLDASLDKGDFVAENVDVSAGIR